MLTVNEIYCSIQGESTYAGLACVFVRLTACDLRCSWCDTPYAFHEGHKMSLDEVIEAVRRFPCRLVELTGGEPLLQADATPLMERLLDHGYTVLVETSGHLPLDRAPARAIRIMDVKCPGSGESHRNRLENVALLQPHDEVKFVIRDRADYEFARTFVAEHGLDVLVSAVHFSPVHGVLAPRDLAAWMLEDGLAVRLQLQQHKYVWGAEVRGV